MVIFYSTSTYLIAHYRGTWVAYVLKSQSFGLLLDVTLLYWWNCESQHTLLQRTFSFRLCLTMIAVLCFFRLSAKTCPRREQVNSGTVDVVEKSEHISGAYICKDYSFFFPSTFTGRISGFCSGTDRLYVQKANCSTLIHCARWATVTILYTKYVPFEARAYSSSIYQTDLNCSWTC